MIETLPFLAVLASALLHATWNAIARTRPDPGAAVAAAVIAAGLACVPGLVVTGLPAASSWPWLAFGAVANTIGIRFIMAAYRHASYGLAYPTMRAGIPLLTLPIAALVLGEWPRPAGVAGVFLIAAALVLLAFAARRAGRDELKGIGFALAAALAGASYVTTDAIGVRLSGNVAAYAFSLAIANAVLLVLLGTVEGARPLATFRRQAGFGFALCVVSMSSFLLYIWAVSVTPVALAAALRESSVLFAVLIARVFLKEQVGRYHWLAAGLALAGIVAIRLG